MSAAGFEGFKERTVAGPAILAAFCLATALVLSGTDTLTRSAIAAREAEDLDASLSQVLPARFEPAARLDVATPNGPLPVFRTIQEGTVTGAAIELTGYGYSGAIRVLVGVAPDGEILGVRVLSHSETPGLGDKIEAEKHDWIEGFAGRSLTNPLPEGWRVQKDGGAFDQFSGATITPRAVVATVRRALEIAERHGAEIFTWEAPE